MNTDLKLYQIYELTADAIHDGIIGRGSHVVLLNFVGNQAKVCRYGDYLSSALISPAHLKPIKDGKHRK